MTRHLFWISILAIAGVPGPGLVSAQQNKPGGEVAVLHAAVTELRNEVAALRGMLLTLRLERHRELISRLKSELETVRTERARLADVDRARRQDLQDIEDLLSRTPGENDQRTTVESARSELAVSRVREITDESEAMNLRESELLRRLHAEQQAARQLEEDARRSEKGPVQ